ncbi:uncharacterized protein [Ptychodera flava]|uniref:uncharacterized protein isoform X2 n=1 Tax=Ptychodera flava TaxID=63121 RepID=UPI00396AB035
MDLLRFRYLLVNGYCPWQSVSEIPRDTYSEASIPEDEMKAIIDREITTQIKRDKLKAYQQTGLPPDPHTWTAHQAATWFRWLSEHCSLDNHFSNHIINNGITGSMLCFMTEQNLHSIFCTHGDNIDVLYQHLQFWKTVEPLEIEEMIHGSARHHELIRRDFTPKLHIEDPVFYQQQQQREPERQQHRQHYITLHSPPLNYATAVPQFLAIPVYNTTTDSRREMYQPRIKSEIEDEPEALDLSTHSSRRRDDNDGCLDLSLKKPERKTTEHRNESNAPTLGCERGQSREPERVIHRSELGMTSQTLEHRPIKIDQYRNEARMGEVGYPASSRSASFDSSMETIRMKPKRQERTTALPVRFNDVSNTMEDRKFQERAPSVPLKPNNSSNNPAEYTGPKATLENKQRRDCQPSVHFNFYDSSGNLVEVNRNIKTENFQSEEDTSVTYAAQRSQGDNNPPPDPVVDAAPAQDEGSTVRKEAVVRSTPLKRKRGRPPKPKPPGFEKRKKVHPILWRFLLEGLNDPTMSDALVWVKKEEGLFRFVSENKDKFARKWGERKGNKSLMTYSKMARALRHYGKKGIFQEFRRRLHYKFNPNYIQKYLMKQKNVENKR